MKDGSGGEYDYFLCFFRSKLYRELTRFAHFVFWGPDCRICESREMRTGSEPRRLGEEKIDWGWSEWALKSDRERTLLAAGGGSWRIRLFLRDYPARAASIRASIELPGIQTRCVSRPRLATEGEVAWNGKIAQIKGTSWFDHEWGSIALPHRWDWWGINLDDGTDLAIRLAGGKGLAHRLSPSGICETTRRVAAAVVRQWKTEAGATYPVEWKIGLPDFGTEINIYPNRDDCETPFHVRYWEGPCRICAQANGKLVRGRGYQELVGYHTLLGRFLWLRARMIYRNMVHR